MSDTGADQELFLATAQDRESMARDRPFPRPASELRKLMQDEGGLRKRLRTEVARSTARTEMLLGELIEAELVAARKRAGLA